MAAEVVVATVFGVILVAAIVIGIIAYRNKNSPYQTHSYRSITSSSSHRQSTKYFHSINKICYDSRDQFQLTNTDTQLYKGTFERSIEVAVKKTYLPPKNKKRIKKDLASLTERLERVVDINHKILSECSVLNIVKFYCYEVEKEKGKWYLLLALELCDCNLEEYIVSRSKYPSIPNRNIILQLLNGLNYLHSRQIVHRDLKPSNILIKQTQTELTFKLSDFGFSKMNTASNNGTPLEQSPLSDEYGTVGWIPPEIFSLRGLPISNPDRSYWKRSDIFPMGLIFYYVETDGQYVYRSQDDIQSGNADFTHISANYPLLQLLRHMLAPNPNDRPFAESILQHPALWSTERTLDFFDNTSNLLMDQTLSGACPIEQNAVNVLGGDWRVHLTPAVENYLFPQTRVRNRNIKSKNQPSYDKTSVQSLLRVIRNNKGHYYQLTPSVQTEFGNFPDGYFNYWISKFPQLLMHTYDAMNVHSTHSCIKKFYV